MDLPIITGVNPDDHGCKSPRRESLPSSQQGSTYTKKEWNYVQIMIVGDDFVGKTCLISQYLH